MTALEQLHALPRAELVAWPSPLQRLDRFSEAIGVEVWCKRDDMGSPGLAGNKVRKYELVLGAALADGADVLITTGAAQSNSARAGAAAAATLGMDCVLVLSGEAPARATANLLLDRLFGADVRFAGRVGWEELNRQVAAIGDELRTAGRRPVTAPVGCSSPLGSLGFALAYLELVDQLENLGIGPSLVVHTSTSGGTSAGLLVGRLLAGGGPPLRAVDAGLVFADPTAGIARLATDALALLGDDRTITADDVDLDLSQLGSGYGKPTEACVEAIRLLARTEGIVCDPVYSGKGLAGLVAEARSGALDRSRPVVFWHTGGWHALFDPHYGDSVS